VCLNAYFGTTKRNSCGLILMSGIDVSENKPTPRAKYTERRSLRLAATRTGSNPASSFGPKHLSTGCEPALETKYK